MRREMGAREKEIGSGGRGCGDDEPITSEIKSQHTVIRQAVPCVGSAGFMRSFDVDCGPQRRFEVVCDCRLAARKDGCGFSCK